MRTTRILVCLLAVLAVSAITAAQAAASPALDAQKYPVKVIGTSVNFHGLAIPEATSICKKVTFVTGEEGAANLASNSPTVILHPNFAECKATVLGGSTGPATWTTTGCNFKFHVVKAGENTGTVDIVCASGKEITIAVSVVPGCTLSLGSQSTLGTIVYKNEPAGEVTINMELSHMKSKIASACMTGKPEAEAEYREGEETGGIVKLATPGHPATIRAKGKFSNGTAEEPDPIEVGLNEPHWYLNHVPIEGGTAPVLMWGKWGFSSTTEPALGSGGCDTEWEGTVGNPEGAGNNAPSGEGKIVGFRADECEDPVCEGKGSKIAVLPKNLGLEYELGSARMRDWEDKLATASGKTRLNIGNKLESSPTRIELTFLCEDIGHGGYSLLASRELSPEVENGTAIGSAPTNLRFGAGSGSLIIASGVTVEFTGGLKMMGFEGGEIISTKNP